MRFDLTRKEKGILLITVLVIITLFIGIYYFLIEPKKSDLALKENELQNEKQLLTTIQTNMKEAGTITYNDSIELQKRVPVKPLIEQLMLEIEKAEVVSESTVKNIAFSEGVAVEQPEEETENTNGTDKENGAEQGSADKQDEVTSSEKTGNGEKPKANSIPLPDGVEKLSVTLNIESPTYFNLQKFIETVESTNRIVVVEKLDFTGTQEIFSTEQEEEPLTYTLIMSAFYMPELKDLIKDLPQIDAPAPSNKRNPLSSFSYNRPS